MDAMDVKEYEVEVVSKHRIVYRVFAADHAGAEEAATDRWRHGEPGDVEGYDWSEVEAAHATEVPDAQRRAEDAELVLRFIGERERLIMRLASGPFEASGNDAISASQVASDLGWGRRGSDGQVRPDVARAMQALEHLCDAAKLVCFERPRVRAGERGDIRLYCTPGYLERLTASIDARPRRAV